MTNPLPALPQRNRNNHKGDFGHAMLIGGSPGMAGAIALSGMAALRTGAGLVTVATPSSCVDIVTRFEPSYMTAALDAGDDGQVATSATVTCLELAKTRSCVGCGPGLGRTPAAIKLSRRLYRRLECAAVWDADALFALAGNADSGHAPAPLNRHSGTRILTPHLGEFRRLVGKPNLSRDDALPLAKQLADQNGIVILLKGAATLITDGQRNHINETGNPGMATGGSGDVLTGVICGLLAQGLDAFEAAALAAHLHGLAGDLAADEFGQISTIASDILNYVPAAIRSLEAKQIPARSASK